LDSHDAGEFETFALGSEVREDSVCGVNIESIEVGAEFLHPIANAPLKGTFIPMRGRWGDQSMDGSTTDAGGRWPVFVPTGGENFRFDPEYFPVIHPVHQSQG
jgi:hypothetical protein